MLYLRCLDAQKKVDKKFTAAVPLQKEPGAPSEMPRLPVQRDNRV